MKVRVRIAVAIDCNDLGNWSSAGFASKKAEVGSPKWDREMQAYAREGCDAAREHLVWVEAEIDVPEVAVVEGKVVP